MNDLLVLDYAGCDNQVLELFAQLFNEGAVESELAVRSYALPSFKGDMKLLQSFHSATMNGWYYPS